MIFLSAKLTKILSFFLASVLLLTFLILPTAAEEHAGVDFSEACVSAVLIDAATGAVLYEHNADAALPPASVTKVMTLLLVMEAIEAGKIALDDTVTVSARAASMGGSQVFLKEGECMSVEEMLKCVIIASANDCAVALAEFVAGSEESFVSAMNARAAELGMRNTHFKNTNGLDDTAANHVTSARDIAIMSRELIAYPKILEYSGTWMDSIREGTFGLTNTNRLVRFYPGCTGLKTGSTAKAGFCISASAVRDGVSLICVIMGAKTRDIRNAVATKLLDYGFASFATYRAEAGARTVPIRGGIAREISVSWSEFSATVPKGEMGRVCVSVEMPEVLSAPISAGDEVGSVLYSLDGKELGRIPIVAGESVQKIEFGALFWQILSRFLVI